MITKAFRADGKDEFIDFQYYGKERDSLPWPDAVKLSARFSRKKKPCAENVFLTFDTETTTIDGTEPYAFVYMWQCCVNIRIGEQWQMFPIYGRSLDDMRLFFNDIRGKLNGDFRVLCFVHNLAFDYYFIEQLLTPIFGAFTTFCRSNNDIVSAESENGLRFADTYALTNMSLGMAARQNKAVHLKIVDTYDYRKIRYPDTELTPEEMSYCLNDVLSLSEIMQNLHSEEKNGFQSMPITSTGYVRRDFRNECKKDRYYMRNFKKTKPLPDQYEMFVHAFRGGDTHASRFYAGQIVENVRHVDFTSSYPSWQMMEDYPIGTPVWSSVKTMTDIKIMRDDYNIIMHCRFYDIETDYPDPYIPRDKCLKCGAADYDNGRVLRADLLEIVITEVDLDILKEEYSWSDFEILGAVQIRKGKIPAPYRRQIMHYYDLKTKLKDGAKTDPEIEYLYNKSKNKLNAGYGMGATRIDHADTTFKNGEWETIPGDMAEKLDKYYSSYSAFIPYQWAVYVTAYARKHLHELINIAGKDSFLYADTDSIFYKANPAIDAKIAAWNEAMKTRALGNDIPAVSYTESGKAKVMGLADYEPDISRFVTYGAKKYACELPNGNFSITVAGLNKKTGAAFFGSIENFKLGTTVPERQSGRTVSYKYIGPMEKRTINGHSVEYGNSIAIVDTTYTLDITTEYEELLAAEIRKEVGIL